MESSPRWLDVVVGEGVDRLEEADRGRPEPFAARFSAGEIPDSRPRTNEPGVLVKSHGEVVAGCGVVMSHREDVLPKLRLAAVFESEAAREVGTEGGLDVAPVAADVPVEQGLAAQVRVLDPSG